MLRLMMIAVFSVLVLAGCGTTGQPPTDYTKIDNLLDL